MLKKIKYITSVVNVDDSKTKEFKEEIFEYFVKNHKLYETDSNYIIVYNDGTDEYDIYLVAE